MRIEYHSNSDRLGRCHFSLYWWDTYFPGHPEDEFVGQERGQNFYADPHKHEFLRPDEVTDP